MAVGVIFALLVLVGMFADPQPSASDGVVTQSASSDPAAATEAPPSAPDARSQQQLSFEQSVRTGQDASGSADNDMQRGGALADRGKSICAALPANKAVTDWIGTVDEISANSDGKGIIVVSPMEDVTIGTWNNAFSDVMHNTLVATDSPVFAAAASLKEGDQVKFSGEFFTDPDHCIVSSNLTLRGKLSDPEFIFRFSTIVPR